MLCDPKTNKCNAECCRYLLFKLNMKKEELLKELKKPIIRITIGDMTTEKRIYFDTRGIQINENTLVFRRPKFKIVNDLLIIETNCSKLKKNLCIIYEHRPVICRDFVGQKGYFVPKDCVFNDSGKNKVELD